MQEWFSRGYIPHRDKAGLIQHVTFHLADSVPEKIQERIKSELAILQNEFYLKNLDEKEIREKISVEKLKRLHELLDAGHGSCILRDPKHAQIVQDAILKFHEEKYLLNAWCIMPNHVHVLFKLLNTPLARIVQSWKSFTALQINHLSGRSGRFWHREYYDRYIRDEKHLNLVRDYIKMNPVNARLVGNYEDWKFAGTINE